MRGHAGQVSAAEALRQSLNLPAVALLDQVGPLRFEEALRAAGAKPRLPPGADPSLPLALGGAGLTMREMAGLYAGLASPGEGMLSLVPGHRRVRACRRPRRRGWSPVSSRSRLPAAVRRASAWKTGTSWGGRDAWAFGFDMRHVVASGSGGRTGRRCPVPPGGARGAGAGPGVRHAAIRAPRADPAPDRDGASHSQSHEGRCACCSRRRRRSCPRMVR